MGRRSKVPPDSPDRAKLELKLSAALQGSETADSEQEQYVQGGIK